MSSPTRDLFSISFYFGLKSLTKVAERLHKYFRRVNTYIIPFTKPHLGLNEGRVEIHFEIYKLIHHLKNINIDLYFNFYLMIRTKARL